MHALDGARGLAAFLILLFHIAGSKIHAFAYLYIAVDFFFILSGFVLASSITRIKNITDARNFLLSRFIRIFPMVLGVIIFTSIYDLLVIVKHEILSQPSSSPIILSFPTLLISFLMLQIFYKPAILVDFPVWSLSAEWMVNITVGLTQAFTPKRRFLFLILGAALIIASGQFESELVNQLGRALWGFSIGLIAFSLLARLSKFRKSLVLISLLLVPVYFLTPKFGWYQCFFSVWPFAAFIVNLSQLNPSRQITKIFSMMGKYSYGFYLWHFPMISLSRIILNHLNIVHISNAGFIPEITLTTILTIIATKITLAFIEEPIRGYWGRIPRMI